MHTYLPNARITPSREYKSLKNAKLTLEYLNNILSHYITTVIHYYLTRQSLTIRSFHSK